MTKPSLLKKGYSKQAFGMNKAKLLESEEEKPTQNLDHDSANLETK